jgi:late competence protein required for DNA uptake (superfamily II DNA/RNA helicase)
MFGHMTQSCHEISFVFGPPLPKKKKLQYCDDHKESISKGNVLFIGFKRLWLRYSISKDAVYCSSCVVLGRKASRDKPFVSTPVNDW